MEFKWLPKCLEHCRKHQAESPEIDPEFIERLMESGFPSQIYPNRKATHRYIFEAFYPPFHGRPYRVVFEVSAAFEIVPVACWRIKDREFFKRFIPFLQGK